jgi:hypothetical protein
MLYLNIVLQREKHEHAWGIANLASWTCWKGSAVLKLNRKSLPFKLCIINLYLFNLLFYNNSSRAIYGGIFLLKIHCIQYCLARFCVFVKTAVLAKIGTFLLTKFSACFRASVIIRTAFRSNPNLYKMLQ